MKLSAAEDLDRTRDHWWWRPGWAPGRRMITFHLTMEHAPAVRELASAAREALAPFDALDLVPERGLHLTMTGVGFADELTDAQVQQISERVFTAWQQQTARPVPPRLEFGELFVAHESAMLLAEPSPWLAELSQAQRDAVDEIVGPQSWGMFWPHLSVAYCNGAIDPVPLIEALTPVAAAAPEQIHARPTLTLMRLGRDEHEYAWDVLRQEASPAPTLDDDAGPGPSNGRGPR